MPKKINHKQETEYQNQLKGENMTRRTKRIAVYMLYCIFFICKTFVVVKIIILYILAASFMLAILL